MDIGYSIASIRPNTTKLIELMDEGAVDPKYVAIVAIGWMEDREVRLMMEANDILIDEDEDED